MKNNATTRADMLGTLKSEAGSTRWLNISMLQDNVTFHVLWSDERTLI